MLHCKNVTKEGLTNGKISDKGQISWKYLPPSPKNDNSKSEKEIDFRPPSFFCKIVTNVSKKSFRISLNFYWHGYDRIIDIELLF